MERARVLVTGATGFIGYHVCERLTRDGVVTYGLSRSAAVSNLPPGVRPLPTDIVCFDDLAAAMQQVGPTCVIHLAAVGVATPTLPSEQATQINATGTANVLRASQAAGVQRLVHVGTAYERGTPQPTEAPYVTSKLAAWSVWQAFVEKQKFDSVAVRLFHVFGPRQSTRGLIGGAILAALRDEVFPMTAGEQVRDFVYVADVVDALLAAAAADNVTGRTYEIGTGVGRSVLSVVQAIFRAVNSRGRLQPGALTYRPGESWHMIAETGPAASDLGWRAQTDFEDGLIETIAYQHKHDDSN